MSMCKPVLYICLFGVMMRVVLAVVKATFTSKPDPDMVATFRAVKTLGKQLKRG